MPDTQLTAEQVRTRLLSLSSRVGNRVHDFHGDDLEPVRSMLLAIVGELDNIAAGLRPTPGERRREIGERTLEWVRGEAPSMPRNRGSW